MPSRLAIALGLAVGIAVTGCTSPDRYLIITVDARPAVHDAHALTVTLSNAGTTRSDSLALHEHPFPVTFSVSAPDRTGELAIAIDASDGNGLVVGHGSATTPLAAATARVELDPTDFVVNTEVAGDQFPSNDFEASGFQLAALADGTWTAVFRDLAPAADASTVFGRRFDATGKPVQTQVSASSNAFPLSTVATTDATTPAVASSPTTTLAVWDFFDVPTTAHGVACRALDTDGKATPAQVLVAGDSADVVSVAALADGNFVASWTTLMTDDLIRTMIIKPDCTAGSAVQTVSTIPGFAHRGSLAVSADRVLYAWVLDGDLHTRMASSTGTFLTDDKVLVARTASDGVVHARVTAAPAGGFLLAARWAQTTGTAGAGRIELFQVNAAGSLGGPAMLITDRSANDASNDESFALARRPDGTVLVAWHTCGALGDDNLCGVFGRIVRDTGAAVTDVFVIPTTTAGDQRRPSVVGLPDAFVALWSDASSKPPDTSGLAVRARLIYLPDTPHN